MARSKTSTSLSPAPEDFWRPSDNGLTSVDLFSGSGGLSLGLHTLGWQGLFAVEKDGMAFETLQANFLEDESPFRAFQDWPTWLPQAAMGIDDLLTSDTTRKRLKRLRGHIDLVAGGPPCQGFSVGGARRGEADPRNDLPYRFVDFVELTGPRLVMLENVEGFDRPFSHQGHKTSYADVILQEFEAIGYSTVKLLVHAVDYGVPQTRRRVILFGVRGKIDHTVLRETATLLLRAYASDFRSTWLPNTVLPVKVADAIEDLNSRRTVVTPDAPRFRSPLYKTPHSEYARLMRAYTDPKDVPDSHRMAIHTDKVRALIEASQALQKSGRLPRAFLQSMGTQSRKKFLLDPDLPASTLTSHPDEFFHYDAPRIITLREGARLQSFPDAFSFHGRYTLNGDRRGLDVSRCAQVGNAIPPLLGRALGYMAERVASATSTRALNGVLSELDELAIGQVALPFS